MRHSIGFYVKDRNDAWYQAILLVQTSYRYQISNLIYVKDHTFSRYQTSVRGSVAIVSGYQTGARLGHPSDTSFNKKYCVRFNFVVFPDIKLVLCCQDSSDARYKNRCQDTLLSDMRYQTGVRLDTTGVPGLGELSFPGSIYINNFNDSSIMN